MKKTSIHTSSSPARRIKLVLERQGMRALTATDLPQVVGASIGGPPGPSGCVVIPTEP